MAVRCRPLERAIRLSNGGNYGMINILSSGRADEKAALEAATLARRQRIESGHPGVREPAAAFVPFEHPLK